MKVCMVGLGSIGKRHLENLVFVLKEHNIACQIDALRSRHSMLPEKWAELIGRQFFQTNEMPDDYDVIFVTNPTSLHYETIREVIEKTKHLFIEKPVFESTDYNLADLHLKKESIYYVACPLRHKSIMKYVKETIVEQEKIISARIISTSFLPEWRKGVDYRNIYSSQKEMGGGVTRDLIHEWDYAVYLFGHPAKVVHMEGHISDLEINCEDVSIYMARYEDMFLEIHLDYFGHKTERTLQIFTNSRRIDVDLISNILYEYKSNRLVHELSFPEEDFYLNEMEYFLECIEGKRNNINTIEDAYSTLKIALG